MQDNIIVVNTSDPVSIRIGVPSRHAGDAQICAGAPKLPLLAPQKSNHSGRPHDGSSCAVAAEMTVCQASRHDHKVIRSEEGRWPR
jgi:hypothetical protein